MNFTFYFLMQMIAMRYGAVPIARKTGGLNDRWASHHFYVYFIGPFILSYCGWIYLFSTSFSCSVFDVDDDTIPTQFRNGYTFLNSDEQVIFLVHIANCYMFPDFEKYSWHSASSSIIEKRYFVGPFINLILVKFFKNFQGLNGAFDRALNHYKNNNQSWQQLVQKVMTIDVSWDSSAVQYEELYEKSVARARAALSRV